MISQDEARARVARGAAHLDQVRPGWFNEIDVGTLTLSNCSRCTLGQLFGQFHFGLAPLDLTFPKGAWRKDMGAVRQGFMLARRDADNPDEEIEGFVVLQDAWIEAIADRRLSQAVDEPESVAAVDRHASNPGTTATAREGTHV